MLPAIPIVVGLFKMAGGLFSNWQKRKLVKSEGKIAITKAKQEFKVAQYSAKSSMDLKSLEGMQFSWKDEFLMLVLVIPVIMCFIPGLDTYVLAGFKVLDQCPDWYKWALTGVIAATFGLRTWTGFKK
jgi:hypothetical protein